MNRVEMVGQTSVWIKVPANHGTSAHRISIAGGLQRMIYARGPDEAESHSGAKRGDLGVLKGGE